MAASQRSKSKGSKRTIADLIREGKAGDDFKKVNQEVLVIHPRSAAILMAADLESTLEFAIIIRLKRNDEKTIDNLISRDGPLSSFSAKIHLAYAMGLVDDDAFNDINIIRRVRNAFAHSPRPIDFSEEVIANECARLRRPATAPTSYPQSDGLDNICAALADDPIRRDFTISCYALSLDIIL